MNETPDTNISVTPPALPFTFKASFKEYTKRLNKGAILAAAGLSVFFFVKFGVLVGILSVIGLVILIALILFFLINRTITLKSDGIDYSNGVGKTRTIKYQDIEGVKVFLNYVEPSFGSFPRVIIGIKGGSPLSLIAVYWPIDDLDKLLAVMRDKAIATEYYDQPVAYGTIAKQFPTYASYIERYPGRIAAIVTVAVFVIGGGVVAAILLLG